MTDEKEKSGFELFADALYKIYTKEDIKYWLISRLLNLSVSISQSQITFEMVKIGTKRGYKIKKIVDCRYMFFLAKEVNGYYIKNLLEEMANEIDRAIIEEMEE